MFEYRECPELLVLIRHGESERNKAKAGSLYFLDEEARASVRGIPDHKIDLTPEGRRQARATGPVLRERFGVPDCSVHSGYARTVQTLEGTLEAYTQEERAKIAIERSELLRERDAGYTYEMTQEEADRYFPFLPEYWRMKGGFFAEPPGGESLAKVVQRLYLFCNEFFPKWAGKRVFLSTHGGTKRCLRYILEQMSYDEVLGLSGEHEPKNCGVTSYRRDPASGRLLLEEYNTVYW